MSFVIPLSSHKHDRAVRFGRTLEAAMTRRQVGSRTLATTIGCSRSSVTYWRTGRLLPRIETADKLAQALGTPHLGKLARELRTTTCWIRTCGKSFTDDSGSDNRRYCSAECARLAEKLKARDSVPIPLRADRAERKVHLFDECVAAFCRACEPAGRCFATDCELRPVSPLPLSMNELGVSRAVSKGRR